MMNTNSTKDGFIAVGLNDKQEVVLSIRTYDGLHTVITLSHDRAKLIGKLLKFITSEKMIQVEGEFKDEQ